MAEVWAKFEKKWGANKIKSVSIYPRNTPVHGKLEIQKFDFVPPPYNESPVTDHRVGRPKTICLFLRSVTGGSLPILKIHYRRPLAVSGITFQLNQLF